MYSLLVKGLFLDKRLMPTLRLILAWVPSSWLPVNTLDILRLRQGGEKYDGYPNRQRCAHDDCDAGCISGADCGSHCDAYGFPDTYGGHFEGRIRDVSP